MASHALTQHQWKPYFDRMARQLAGAQAEVEVESLAMGSQIQAEWVPLIGISYDPHDNAISIALEGLQHFVRNPMTIFVDDNAGEVSCVEIRDEQGGQTIVRLRYPLALPGS